MKNVYMQGDSIRYVLNIYINKCKQALLKVIAPSLFALPSRFKRDRAGFCRIRKETK